jgi:hypothetical protein
LIEIAIVRGRTLVELETMDPRDMATFIDVWEERDAAARRGYG